MPFQRDLRLVVVHAGRQREFQRIDRRGPTLASVIELNPDAGSADEIEAAKIIDATEKREAMTRAALAFKRKLDPIKKTNAKEEA